MDPKRQEEEPFYNVLEVK